MEDRIAISVGFSRFFGVFMFSLRIALRGRDRMGHEGLLFFAPISLLHFVHVFQAYSYVRMPSRLA